MARVFIGVGSNIEPEESIRRALRKLAGTVRIVGISTFYRNPAEGRPEQPDFINGALEIETELSPGALKRDVLSHIEADLGRKRTADKYAPRTIDLDILLPDDSAEEEIARRAFLAVPLAELAPDYAFRGSGKTLREIAEKFAGHAMEPLPGYTEMIRRDIRDESPTS